jgi:2,4-dienoyl-CoA reductase-like NADH-dependent reductase (Old Yellow Enzyme family)
VQVDRRYLESPCNVALEAHDEQPERLALFRDWATAIQHDGAKAIMQLSHCGRQCPYSVCSSPLAPSAVPLRLPGLPAWAAPVGHPREMSAADISDVIARFATSARLACLAGFDGVQLHRSVRLDAPFGILNRVAHLMLLKITDCNGCEQGGD